MKNNFMKKAFALMTSIITVSATAISINTVAVDSPTQDNLPAVKLTTSSISYNEETVTILTTLMLKNRL